MAQHLAIDALRAATAHLEHSPLTSLADLCTVLDCLAGLAVALQAASDRIPQTEIQAAHLPASLLIRVHEDVTASLLHVQHVVTGPGGGTNRTGASSLQYGPGPEEEASLGQWSPLDEAAVADTLARTGVTLCHACMELRGSDCPLHGPGTPFETRQFLRAHGGAYPHLSMRSLVPLMPHPGVVQALDRHPAMWAAWRVEVAALPPTHLVAYCLCPGPLSEQYPAGSVMRWPHGATALASLPAAMSLAQGPGPHSFLVVEARTCRALSHHSVRPRECEVAFPNGALLLVRPCDPSLTELARPLRRHFPR